MKSGFDPAPPLLGKSGKPAEGLRDIDEALAVIERTR
jgi:hypothetical protein